MQHTTKTTRRRRSTTILSGAALEEYLWQGQQRQRGRAGVVGRGRRHMRRSNLKYARRPEGWREWLAALVKRRLHRHSSKPILVSIRPGVPHVDAALADPERRAAILAEARKLLPRHQYERVYPRWVATATPAAERKAARAARVAERRACLNKVYAHASR